MSTQTSPLDYRSVQDNTGIPYGFRWLECGFRSIMAHAMGACPVNVMSVNITGYIMPETTQSITAGLLELESSYDSIHNCKAVKLLTNPVGQSTTDTSAVTISVPQDRRFKFMTVVFQPGATATIGDIVYTSPNPEVGIAIHAMSQNLKISCLAAGAYSVAFHAYYHDAELCDKLQDVYDWALLNHDSFILVNRTMKTDCEFPQEIRTVPATFRGWADVVHDIASPGYVKYGGVRVNAGKAVAVIAPTTDNVLRYVVSSAWV